MKPTTNLLVTTLSGLSGPWTLFLALLLAVLIGILDLTTGYDFHETALYMLPVCWVAWRMGYRPGLLLAAASAFIFAVASLMSRHSEVPAVVPLWNAAMLLLIFVGAIHSITSGLNAYKSLTEAQILLKNTNDHLEETVQQRTASLRSEIAQRERLQMEQLQTQRLLERQEKLAVLGTLTAGIAHEIRNPLTSIKARLYTLEKHLHSLPAAIRDADVISSEISRLERIVQDVLGFARPSDPKLEVFSAKGLILEVQGLLSSDLDSHGLKLEVGPCPDLFIRGDRSHLKQVLINLVRNAAEASERLGIVTLATRASRTALDGSESETVIIDVVDNGRGIPPEIERRLFDPFFSTKETGTGLGLAIASRIVEKHGGLLQYQTRPGYGSTFSVVLLREIAESADDANSQGNIQPDRNQAQP